MVDDDDDDDGGRRRSVAPFLLRTKVSPRKLMTCLLTSFLPGKCN